MLEQAENLIESSAERIEYVKAYADKKLTLFKISIIEAVAGTLGLILNRLLVLVLTLLVLFFLSTAGALYLGERWSSLPLGFGLVGGIYGVFLIFFLLSDGNFLRDAIVKIWSTSLLDENDMA